MQSAPLTPAVAHSEQSAAAAWKDACSVVLLRQELPHAGEGPGGGGHAAYTRGGQAAVWCPGARATARLRLGWRQPRKLTSRANLPAAELHERAPSPPRSGVYSSPGATALRAGGV